MGTETGKVYFDYRSHLVNSRQKSYEQFDKAIFILSGGALTVSFAFLKDIVPLATSQFKPLLLCSWLCFTLSLVFTLISYKLSIKAIDKQIEIADDYFTKEDTEAFNRKNTFSEITERVNYSSAGLFIIGLIFHLGFAYLNIK